MCPALPPPLHLVSGVLEWDALAWRDRVSVLGMATPLKNARRALSTGSTRKAASDGETVENWLIRNGQSARLREMLWDPLALAALNQPPHQAAAPSFARVLAEMFGSDSQAAAIALPTRPLHQMYAEPAREYIERRGGTVLTGAAAKIRIRGEDVIVETTISAETDEKKIAPRSLRSYGAGRVISSVGLAEDQGALD